MRFLRVEYDAYNRQFKLLDQEMARELHDGETYLIADGGDGATEETSDFVTIPGENGNIDGLTVLQSLS